MKVVLMCVKDDIERIIRKHNLKKGHLRRGERVIIESNKIEPMEKIIDIAGHDVCCIDFRE